MVYVIPVGNRSAYIERTTFPDGTVIERGLPGRMHTIQWDAGGNGILKAYYREDIVTAISRAKEEAASYGVKHISFGKPEKTTIKDKRWLVTNWN
jgi:hypothetical protein